MPELPEVQTIMDGIAPTITGARVEQVIVRRSDLRVPVSADIADIEGRSVTSLSRRSKYLLIHFTGNLSVILHLGMSGKLQIACPEGYEFQKHDHLALQMEARGQSILLIYNDPRRFGLCVTCATDGLKLHKLLAEIGIEPLEDAFDGAHLHRLCATSKRNIKTFLLDGKMIAGIGNIYACESLFYARIHPERRACDITAKEAGALAAAIKTVLREAIASGGSTLRDYVRSDGGLGYFQHKFAVFQKNGEICPACNKTVIENKRIGGRSTFFCPECQI